MAEDLIQQLVSAAPAAGGGGVLGALSMLMAVSRLFAKPQDVELAKAQLKAEFAEKYVSKDMLQPIMDKLDHIQNRVDQLADRK